ncbi:hypothetical protein HDU82_000078, partial [Entophlyctis luteolus]
MMASYELQEWAATYILFLIWCIALFMAPFMAYTKSSGATINDGDAGLYGSTSTPAAVIASMRGADTVKRYNRAVHFSENARIGFLLVFASTVAHEVAAIRHNTGAYRVTAGLTWASLAVEII